MFLFLGEQTCEIRDMGQNTLVFLASLLIFQLATIDCVVLWIRLLAILSSLHKEVPVLSVCLLRSDCMKSTRLQQKSGMVFH